MKLTLISHTDKHTFEIDWLEVNSSNAGNFVMQQGHAPMILLLAPHQPIIYSRQDGKQESMLLEGSGILHITRHEATIILTS